MSLRNERDAPQLLDTLTHTHIHSGTRASRYRPSTINHRHLPIQSNPNSPINFASMMYRKDVAIAAAVLSAAFLQVSSFSPVVPMFPAVAPRSIAHITSSHTGSAASPRRIEVVMSAATAEEPFRDSSSGGGRLFEPLGKGVLRDYKARLPSYKSDITDGLNSQALAATVFLFFACLAPAVGFGSLFEKATGGAIGTIEMLSSTASCGLIYALTSAQPLTIIGSTGVVLAFVTCLVQFANTLNVPFLPLYGWTGIWASGILAISSLTSASNLVKYMTRFTDEIFSVLISTIFVVEAVSDVSRSFTSPGSTLSKALLTLLCTSVTFATATFLKGLRNTTYFTKKIRNTISNFAPTIGIVFASFLARAARLAYGPATAGLPCLSIPQKFATTSGRPWLVPLLDLPVWARWGALLPALMAVVLLFLDQNITVRLVNNPQYSMEKGRKKGSVVDGMHADLLVIAILTLFQSVVGLPWLIAATVRSISHVRALSQFDDKGKVNGSMEQRVTGASIHTLIGCCVLFPRPRMLLSLVPLPVLMGLFMYLGTSTLPGNEMYERIKGIFKEDPATDKPRWSSVPKGATNLFTAIQVTCLGAMFWVKESPIGVLFPVVIALLAPLRFALERKGVIEKKYMDILDEE